MIKQYNCTGVAGNHHHPLILYTDMSKVVLSHLLVSRCKSGDIVGHLARQVLRRSEASKLSIALRRRRMIAAVNSHTSYFYIIQFY